MKLGDMFLREMWVAVGIVPDQWIAGNPPLFSSNMSKQDLLRKLGGRLFDGA